MHRGKMSHLQTGTEQPLNMGWKILLRIRLSALCVRVWFGIAPNLAVDMSRWTSFLDRFIRSIFPSKRKVVF